MNKSIQEVIEYVEYLEAEVERLKGHHMTVMCSNPICKLSDTCRRQQDEPKINQEYRQYVYTIRADQIECLHYVRVEGVRL